ncbi:rod shape-determining protein MreC [Patescibacteria group bacterium]|nr:rod shape-determining protein MreC [Patescibacteria group bacterium]MBU4512894.1 rod shape-determining protein MreC [Patescibacteria group bacterium]MCG2692616.1 rod shape-determining protein MreC [Candidatus Parcubacteria bacterium]
MNKLLSKTVISITTVAVLLIFFHSIGWLKPFEALLAKSVGKPQEFVYNIALGFKNIFTGIDFKEENTRLKAELEEHIIDGVALKLLEEENKRLRQELNFLEIRGYAYVLAHIIAREPELDQKIVILNQGSAQGIKKGCPVIITRNDESSFTRPEGFLVGKIIKVSTYKSWVVLLPDNRSAVAAEIQSRKALYGLVKGERGLSLNMDLIPQGTEIIPGDTVITSGLENMIPKGLIIGEAETIESVPGDFFQKAKIKPLVSFDNLNLVTVLIPN